MNKELEESLEPFDRFSCLSLAVNFLSFCSAATTMSSGRAKGDFLSDRLAMASNEETLFGCLALFRKSLNVGPGKDKEMLLASTSKFADVTLRLIREYPVEITALIFTKKEDKSDKIWNLFDLANFEPVAQENILPRDIDFPINITMKEPLIHGDENKQGNAILFRRRRTATGASIPFYSANSIGHALRVLLAEDFLRRIGLHQSTTDRRYKVWFNEFLHNGGKLGAAPKEFCVKIGGSADGNVKSDGMIELRNMMPFISLMGGNAKGSFEGRISIKDLRPICKEWGTGDRKYSDLLSWEFGTTPDPFSATSVSKSEAKKTKEDGGDAQANSSMIYKFQVLSVGSRLEGGFNISDHATEIERSCLGHGIDLFIKRGNIGGKSNKGFGECSISCENTPNPNTYINYLEENKEEIKAYIDSIGAH